LAEARHGWGPMLLKSVAPTSPKVRRSGSPQSQKCEDSTIFEDSLSLQSGARPRGRKMPLYMLQFAYSQESWAALIKKPEDRAAALESIAKSLGARLVSLYYHSGEYDGTVVVEAPDDATANALVFSVVASGTLRSSRTTRLYTPRELVESLGKAGKASYRPPGKP
jgi:uncharacterized protein with GYD domain